MDDEFIGVYGIEATDFDQLVRLWADMRDELLRYQDSNPEITKRLQKIVKTRQAIKPNFAVGRSLSSGHQEVYFGFTASALFGGSHEWRMTVRFDGGRAIIDKVFPADGE